jgi:predicted  nucleic acid-binding Zn-ribbon protein
VVTVSRNDKYANDPDQYVVEFFRKRPTDAELEAFVEEHGLDKVSESLHRKSDQATQHQQDRLVHYLEDVADAKESQAPTSKLDDLEIEFEAWKRDHKRFHTAIIEAGRRVKAIRTRKFGAELDKKRQTDSQAIQDLLAAVNRLEFKVDALQEHLNDVLDDGAL